MKKFRLIICNSIPGVIHVTCVISKTNVIKGQVRRENIKIVQPRVPGSNVNFDMDSGPETSGLVFFF